MGRYRIFCRMGKTYLSPIVQHSIDRFVLFGDNLSAQVSDGFKKSVSDLNGVCWYGLPNATDIWQPVDAGYAELLKVFLNQKHHEWLDSDDNATKWYESTQSFSRKERRILLTHWVGEAYKKLINSQ